uniref:Protein FAM184B isoform X2 n=1 Tax=Geotrypetes seraphini TaxID=260995 RepID=A0A6P8P9D2_GEOSA|nr:protein FAM184B isoform X2 [Geotrypetes seraphini]
MTSGKVHLSGICNGSKSDQFNSAEEYSQEIHMKMCKKIAQLTKVIYALNSKNDELEANIQALKEAHQEEIDQIISETREEILQYKNKVGEELDLRLRLQTLEEVLDHDKKLKEEALADFAIYRMQAKDIELRTKTEHAERITTLSKEMLDMKKDFEIQLQSLKQEADNLRKECRVNGRGRSEGKEKVKENHNLEVQALLNELENLKLENQKITEEYAEKTDKLEATYEKEKEVLKKTLQQSVEETSKQWQHKELEQRQVIKEQEATLLQQVKKLEADMDTKGQQINELKKHSHKMKERVQDLERQLREAQHETLESRNTLKKMEEELTVAKERLILQENEIYTKTEQMKTALSSQSEAIQEADKLKSQINQLQQKIIEKPNHSRKGSEDSTVLKQIAQLKQTLEQQTANYKEVLKARDVQSIKEKEKLLQDLQDNIKQNQMMKAQLEASHQKSLKVLEKKKNQELKEAQEWFRKEYNDSLKREHQSHRLQIQALEKKAKQELQREHSVRAELSEQKNSCASHKKQIEELLQELKHLKRIKKQQEESKQTQMKTLNDELDKCCSEVSALRKKNSLLKDSMELLRAQAELQKHEATQLQEREKQQRRLMEEDLEAKQKTELEALRQDHKKEIQNLVVDFSGAQAHLQAKIVSLENELKELKAKPRKWESRLEDLQLIGRLQDKLTEKDQVVKMLMDERKLQATVLSNVETQRNRSFSCNPNHGCLTATIKRKKMEEAPNRVVSVPNLASHENLSKGDLILKCGTPPIAKSPGVEQTPCTRRPCQKSAEFLDSKPIIRTQGKEISKTKESQDHAPKRPEWFTKYFSF